MKRTLITGGTVLVGAPLTGAFEEVDVLVEDGRITGIGPDLPREGAEVLDARGTFVLPGFVDAHSHLWEASMRGIAADWDVVHFAWGIRYNHAALHAPEDLYAGAHAGALVALDSGTTTALDQAHATNSPDHADEALRAVVDAGLRTVWCYGLNEVPLPSPVFTSPEQRWADARRVRAALGGDGRVTFGLAPNDVLSVPWSQTVQEFALARELDAPLTVHANTTWGPYRVPEVELLAHDGLLGPRQVYSHGGASSDHELDLLAAAGATLVSTPVSELQMGLGAPAFGRARARSVAVGLGSDLQADGQADPFTVMRVARQAENGRVNQAILDDAGMAGLSGAPVSVRETLHLATLGGAAALGLAGSIGSLEVGKLADVVLLRHDGLRHQPVVDPFATVVEHSQPADVDTVLVGGTVLKRSGVLVGGAADRAASLVGAAWERLSERMRDRGGLSPALPDGLLEQAAAGAAANAPQWLAAR